MIGLWLWTGGADAAELELPDGADRPAWQAELARIDAAVSIPEAARIHVAATERGWRVTVTDGDGCAADPFDIPDGPAAIRAALWVAATLLDAPCSPPAARIPLPPEPQVAPAPSPRAPPSRSPAEAPASPATNP
ncbi:MAG: hypothetical protein ABMB14_39015, partial [Myxococcota bacterium]